MLDDDDRLSFIKLGDSLSADGKAQWTYNEPAKPAPGTVRLALLLLSRFNRSACLRLSQCLRFGLTLALPSSWAAQTVVYASLSIPRWKCSTRPLRMLVTAMRLPSILAESTSAEASHDDVFESHRHTARYLATGGADSIVSLIDLQQWLPVRAFSSTEYVLHKRLDAPRSCCFAQDNGQRAVVLTRR